MKENTKKYWVLGALVIAICIVIAVKNQQSYQQAAQLPDDSVIGKGKPVLLELGSHSCSPCRRMMPILDELSTEQSAFVVAFIDTQESRETANYYRIELIPTQIFFDSGGNELFRHVGFYPKEEILAKWKELGVEVKPAP